MAGVGGIVSNPSGLTIQSTGGTVFCFGAAADVAGAQFKGLANTAYLIVYNCTNNRLYAKTAQVGPGSAGTSVGIPATQLQPVAGVEVGLATVTCGASTCATIADVRVPSQWANGSVQGAHILTPLANSDIAFTITLAGSTATKTFTVPYQVAPVCVATDQTTAQLVKVVPSTTNVVVSDTVGATDVIAVVCSGNPN
jgi:rhodanese-related sulfurtransferase